MLSVELIIVPIALIPVALNYWGFIHTHFERRLLAILLMTGAGLWSVALVQKSVLHGQYSWGTNAANAILIAIFFVSVGVYRRTSHISTRFLVWLYGGGAVVFGGILVLNFYRF